MSRPGWAPLLGVGLLTALGVLGPAAGAHAADPLELSLDGTTWSPTLPVGLFASPAAAVPGDVLVSALWVRNGSADPARVSLRVADDLGVGTGTLASDLSLRIDGTPVAAGATWLGPDLQPGAAARVDLVVTYAATSARTSRHGTAAVLDTVTLVQTGVGRRVTQPTAAAPVRPIATIATTTTTREPADPPLAHTGADAAGVLGAALAATLGGAVLVAARRRSRSA